MSRARHTTLDTAATRLARTGAPLRRLAAPHPRPTARTLPRSTIIACPLSDRPARYHPRLKWSTPVRTSSSVYLTRSRLANLDLGGTRSHRWSPRTTLDTDL